ncbi:MULTISPECIES: M48 family metallopeptidase [Nitrosomonas]|uniref:Peptidase n=1 Tax=Nitrosomonas communis TaxID=44574 RepID=A0A0F7KBV4_9PROT|nr:MULTISPECIES: M48 family metallopeptidase [Nitrosomonas]AKH37081.1 peptidase [Nitrosomonas communis]TYP78620.1 peptidase M48-like protein [Nitrosomonas communis]UVS62243.1 M48 family metallopeptidase [Nitrosomonas sp. PLL12]
MLIQLCLKMCLLLLSVLFLTACATTPTGRTQLAFMPDAEVNNMGLQAFENLKHEKPISRNVQDNQFVHCVASAIAREVGGEWEVVVFEDPALNAFALPGGKIGVYAGLVNLVDNQDQLATVIGHEVGHVLARHSNERLSQQLGAQAGITLVQAIAAPQTAMGQTAVSLLGIGAEYGIILPFSRLHESEADTIGLDLMAKAGFNPAESVALWLKMEQASQGPRPVEFLSTHPSHTTRIKDLQARIPKAQQLQQQAKAAGKNPHCVKG